MYIARFYKNKLQSVKEHLSNVSTISKKYGKEIGMGNFLYLCGYLHDIGKYSDDFQKYIKQEQENEQKGIVEHNQKIDHGVYGAKFVSDLESGGKQSVSKYAKDMMMEVICYHHGGLPDNIAEDRSVPILDRIAKVNENSYQLVINRFFEENRELSKEKIQELFRESTRELQTVLLKFPKQKRGLYVSLLIEHIYSILVDADRWDSYLFTIGYKFKEETETIRLWEKYEHNLNDRLEQFKQKKPQTELEKKVFNSRQAISDLCKAFAENDTGIYNLTVPTGGGKTLSSLNFALNHALKHHKERIIYVIPYTSILEQNAEEVRTSLDAKDSLLEYHSNILDCHKNENYEIYSERWTSPIIFTTMVQFLNAVYAAGNDNSRRMHNLTNAVIIFDEIQTLPIKCIQLFYTLIGYLRDVCHTTSVLCTATQPNLMYISEKLEGIGFNGEMIPEIERKTIFHNLKRMEVIDKTNTPMDLEAASDFILKTKQNEKSILVVANTVSSAQNLYLKAVGKADCDVYLLTSRMCPYHRKEILSTVKQKLREQKDVICISTQLIEAGVDISFACVIRSLAGLDSIAQATGRGNRHGERAIGYSYIIRLKEENVTSLREISLGQSHSQNVMHLCSKSPQAYPDLLSEQALHQYYCEYFNDGEIKKSMSYPLENNKSMISLLNNKAISIADFNGAYPLAFWSQFKTAKTQFHVIEQQTETVVVPYNAEATMLIGELLSDAYTKKPEVLKKLQPYCVSLYAGTMQKLRSANAFIHENVYQIHILSDLFYSKEMGVNLEKSLNIESNIY